MTTKRTQVVIPPVGRQQLQGLNPQQQEYLKLLKSQEQVFAIGRAGTGKTYMPTAYAADLMISRDIKRLILARPAVDAGESLGYLPGTLEEKMGPWVLPFIDVLKDRLGKQNFQNKLDEEFISFESFQHMRGRTFNDAMIILDEAQNTTPSQMKLFLTRHGLNSKVVITGDLRQSDIKGKNGLQWALDINQRYEIAPVVELVKVERSDLAGKWADAIEAEES